MLKRLTLTALTTTALCVGALGVGAFSPAAAGCGLGSCKNPPAPVDNGSSVVVSVTGTYVKGGSPGSPSTTTVSVPAPCHYFAFETGAAYAKWADAGGESYNGADGERHQVPIDPGYKAHANETTKKNGQYYSGVCESDLYDGSLDGFVTMSNNWFKSHPDVWVAAGDQPPTPPIPPQVLLMAAQKAMQIPQPTFNWNPHVKGAASVVNLDTWFWTNDDIAKGGTITASAGGNSATVNVSLGGVTYSSPDGGSKTCADGGVAWSPGATSTCSLTFTRATAAEPVTATADWTGTWSYDGTPKGAVDINPTTETHPIPVIEVQSVVRDGD